MLRARRNSKSLRRRLSGRKEDKKFRLRRIAGYPWQDSANDLKYGKKDVLFIIGDWDTEMFEVHKKALMEKSPVFSDIFTRPLPKVISLAGIMDTVEVPDLNPKAFACLLTYVYTEKVELDFHSVFDFMLAADKYSLTAVTVQLSDFVMSNMQIGLATSAFEVAVLISDEKLKVSALRFINLKFDAIIKSKDFLNISHRNLCYFLKSEDVAGKEIDIFFGMIRWAKHLCKRYKLNPNKPKNIRDALNTAIHLIRFPLMSEGDFKRHVVPTKLLADNEIYDILEYIAYKDQKVKRDHHADSIKPRREIAFNHKRRYHLSKLNYEVKFDKQTTRSIQSILFPTGHGGNWIYQRFKCDRSIRINSIGLFGPNFSSMYAVDISEVQRSYTVELRITETETSKVILDVNRRQIMTLNEFFNFDFNPMLQVDEEIWLTIGIRLSEPNITIDRLPAKQFGATMENNKRIHVCITDWSNIINMMVFHPEL